MKKLTVALLAVALSMPARADVGWTWVWGSAFVVGSVIVNDLASRKEEEANIILDSAVFHVDYLGEREKGRVMQSKALKLKRRGELAGLIGISILTAGFISVTLRDNMVYVEKSIKFGGN